MVISTPSPSSRISTELDKGVKLGYGHFIATQALRTEPQTNLTTSLGSPLKNAL
jgi:hypothetical protein